MANHKSAKKRILVTKKKNIINTAHRSEIKTVIKKALQAIESNDKEKATLMVRDAESKIMKQAGKSLPKRRASRKVSRLFKRLSLIK